MIEKQLNLTNILDILDLTNKTTRSINLLGLEGLVGIMRLTGFKAQKLLDSYIYMYVYISLDWNGLEGLLTIRALGLTRGALKSSNWD